MKVTSVRDFRKDISRILEGHDPVVVTKHGTPTAILMPLPLVADDLDERMRKILIEIVGAEVRRQLEDKGVAPGEIYRDLEEFRSSEKSRG
ncbi:MAG: type II toxin-antitoxin system Phd/YefM family antitoxin [Planctomycetes bacterium]|nr:type II toxin-antitoxin system Phd/YefM family antitoxin [Planctomycetota bacterium]